MHLELLGLSNPDLNLGHVAQTWSTEQSNLLLLCETFGVLGIQFGIVNAL